MELIIGLFTIVGGIIGWFFTYMKFKLERKDKFRMAAIEKRLEAHQKAYAQCMTFFDIMNSRDEDEVQKVFKAGQDFMANYSLYLEKGTREKFVEALGFINAYCPRWDYLRDFQKEEYKSELKRIHQESEKIFELSRIIQKEVELEPITLEIENISKQK